MATVRIYKVAELLNTSSQEVLALLKRAHGIELKSASSTIEEVVARQFVERLARERSITLPGGDMFAEGPASKPGAKKPAASCKEAGAGKARRADARAAAARENLEARCACRSSDGSTSPSRKRRRLHSRRTRGSAGADRRSAHLRGWRRFGGQPEPAPVVEEPPPAPPVVEPPVAAQPVAARPAAAAPPPPSRPAPRRVAWCRRASD